MSNERYVQYNWVDLGCLLLQGNGPQNNDMAIPTTNTATFEKPHTESDNTHDINSNLNEDDILSHKTVPYNLHGKPLTTIIKIES